VDVSETKTLVELQEVRKGYRFGETVVNALDGVSLKIQEGSFVGIIGRSGSGKSTMLNLLGGLDRPSHGQLLVDGRALQGRSSDDLAAYRREMVGFVFQSFNLIPHLTAVENVALPLALAGRSVSDRRQRAEELLTRVGLAQRMTHRPMELSGGERQRVAIARALVNEPRLLLADEPTGNLDSNTAEEIMGMLQSLHAEGRTIVLVTHDAERAERYCERMVIFSDGKVVEDRTSASAPGDDGAAA
jgi:putative ABC transport system ATP-binding protein